MLVRRDVAEGFCVARGAHVHPARESILEERRPASENCHQGAQQHLLLSFVVVQEETVSYPPQRSVIVSLEISVKSQRACRED